MGAARVVCGVALALAMGAPARAQTVVERTPNLEGIWAPRAGALQFNFLHRFQTFETPTDRIISASPTFVLAAGAPGRTAVGVRFAPASALVAERLNEWELFARWVPLLQVRGAAADVGVQLSHNRAAASVDGEVLVARDLGPVRLLAGGRAFSSFAGGDSRLGAVAGGRVRITRHVALGADGVMLTGEDREAAWSGGVQLAIPYTPHSLSLHVTNVPSATLQSGSFGLRGGERRWGFEFTTPLTWGRFRGEASPVPPAAPAGDVAAVVRMDNTMSYLPDTVRIRVGERVLWRNDGAIIHTVTADPSRAVVPANVALPEGARTFDSGDMRPGAEFVHRFTVPGEYRYICVPHEMAGMVGVVVVEAAGAGSDTPLPPGAAPARMDDESKETVHSGGGGAWTASRRVSTN